MIQPLRRGAVLAVVAGALVAITGLTQAQDENAKSAEPRESAGQDAKGPASSERDSGVILKVETIAKEGKGHSGKGRHHHAGTRVTINTAVPWSDWVRDQAVAPAEASSEGAKAETKKGEGDSVATEGQPVSPDTIVVVEITPATKVETRYRSSTDQVTEGSPSPEGAGDVEKSTDPAEGKKPGAHHRKDHQTKAERAEARHLKPRQFVDVEYTEVDGHNHASRIIILKPIGGPNTPASEDQPEPKAGEKKAESK